MSTVNSVQQMTRKRYVVLAIVFLVNMMVWMDEGVFGVLTPIWSKSLHLTSVQIGTVSAAYLLGYFPLLLLAGVLSDRIGARTMLLICIAGTALSSAGMLFVHSYTEMYWRNLIFGFFFGFLWAPCNKMMAMWLPSKERARYTAIWMSFTLLASAIAAPIALPAAAAFGWRPVFLVVSILGVPLFFCMWFFTTNTPEQKKRISESELAYIYSDRPSAEEMKAEKFQWSHLGKVFKMRSFWTMAIATGLGTSPTWLIGTWGSYGLLNGYKLSPGFTSSLIALPLIIPIVIGLVIGPFVKMFGGKTRPAIAFGPLISGLGFLAVAFFHMGAVSWAILIVGIGYATDPFFWGTVNAYWAGLAKPEYSGTLNGISAAMQVAVGYVMVNASGNWVSKVSGPAMLNHIWLIGGIVFLATVVFVYLSREVKVNTEVKLDDLASTNLEV